MVIELEAYQIFMIVVAVIGAVVGMIKLLGSQIKHNIDMQLNANREANKEGFEQTQKMVSDLASQAAKGQEELRLLERKFYEFQIGMPHHYVARDDYIRGQSIIEAKLDAQYEQIKTVQIQQGVR